MTTTIKIDPAVRDRLRDRHPNMTLSDAVAAALDAEERAAFLDAEAEAERTYSEWFAALDSDQQEAVRSRDRDLEDWAAQASR